MGEVTQMEDNTVFRHGFPPVADKFSVHFLGISEWPSAIADDVLVTKMGVGGEPDLFGVEFVDLFGHNSSFCLRLVTRLFRLISVKKTGNVS